MMEKFIGMPTKEFIRELKRQEIIRCATIHFAQKGFGNVSLSEIASDLGVTKAALYNYTTGKSDLLVQCYIAAVDGILAELHDVWNKVGTGAERLLQFLHAWVKALDQPSRQILWAYPRPVSHDPGSGAVHAKISDFCSRIRDLLVAGREDGSIVPNVDLEVVPLVIVGGVSAAFAWIEMHPESDRDELLRKIVEEAVRGYLTTNLTT